MYLTDDIKITIVQAPLADGQTDPNSTSVDMTGFDGVMFIGTLGTVTATGTVTLAAESSSDNAAADPFAAMSGATASATAADSDLLLIVDIQNPLERYVRTALTRAVANTVYGGTIAIQYTAHNKPCVTATANLAAAIVQVIGV